MAALLPKERQFYNQSVVGLDADAKTVTLASGRTIKYNKLLSTMSVSACRPVSRQRVSLFSDVMLRVCVNSRWITRWACSESQNLR